jgi:hypothetical protein
MPCERLADSTRTASDQRDGTRIIHSWLLFLRRRYSATQIDRSAALAHIIAIPIRNLKNDVAFNDRLASKTGMRRQSRGFIQSVRLVILDLDQIVVRLVLQNHVAGRAGAISSAGVLELDAKIQANIQDRRWFSVLLIWQLLWIKLDGSAFRQNGYFGHSSSIPNALK